MMDKSMFEKISSESWVLDVRRPQCWLAESTQIIANNSELQKKYLGFDCSYKNYLILNGDEYYLEPEGKTYDDAFEREYRKDKTFLSRFTKVIKGLADMASLYRKRLSSTDVKDWTDHQLTTEVLKFQDYYTLSYLPAWSRPDGFLEAEVKRLLKKELNFSPKEIEDVFSKLATYPSTVVLAYSNEPLDLLKIALEVKRGRYNLENLPKHLSDKLLRHVQNYSWLKTLAQTDYVFFTLGEYHQRLRLMLEKDIEEKINRIKSVRLQNDKNYEQLKRSYHFSPQLRRLIDTMRKFIYLRTHTTEVSDHLLITGRQVVLAEAAKRLGLTNEQIVTLASAEITQLLEGKKMTGLEDTIAKRQAAYCLVLVKQKLTILIGKEAQDFYDKFTPVFNRTIAKVDAVIVTGSPASIGRVTGPAKVLFTHSDIAKVDKGDILVAPVTTPDYILAMEKAAAFVTDEGGITSHAAIVAREFGVPCVVGTKVATKIFRDGDIIEVDASNGIVKKII